MKMEITHVCRLGIVGSMGSRQTADHVQALFDKEDGPSIGAVPLILPATKRSGGNG